MLRIISILLLLYYEYKSSNQKYDVQKFSIATDKISGISSINGYNDIAKQCVSTIG